MQVSVSTKVSVYTVYKIIISDLLMLDECRYSTLASSDRWSRSRLPHSLLHNKLWLIMSRCLYWQVSSILCCIVTILDEKSTVAAWMYSVNCHSKVLDSTYRNRNINEHSFFGRPYGRLWYPMSSGVCLSVTFCIVAKRHILAKNCLKEQIG